MEETKKIPRVLREGIEVVREHLKVIQVNMEVLEVLKIKGAISFTDKDFIEIIDFVENKINKIRRSASDLDSYRLALLASINIAEELFTLKQENMELKKFLNKIDNMVPKIDFIDDLKKRPVKILPEQ